ncbi:hypothetical protein SAMN06272721_11728 [Arthrobacter sp. P2b]|nr:hypothetical protein SAMN06272721_11728 [Arthrobacter sp. P2b]
MQLRFRLGTSYTFPGELRGWNSRPDSSYDLELSSASLSDIDIDRYNDLDPESRNTLQIKADIAVRWMERARFTGEPVIEVLYLTFALEALLGDTQAGLKSGLIARRQLMLSHIMTGMIPHPDQTIMLYGEVRSKAVHGETAREISSQEAAAFHLAVKNAFDQYLDLASRENIQTQSKLTTLLDKHDEHETLVEWLALNGGPEWAKYFRSQKRNH